MSIVETVLVFVCIPVGIFVLAAAVILGPGAARAPRYRPGAPWTYQPVWYLPHPEHAGPVSSLSPAQQAGARSALSASIPEPTTAVGGASGEW